MPYPNYTTQELAAINSYLQNEADLARDQRNLLREINDELSGKINNVKEASKQYRTLEDIAKRLQEDAEEMNKLTDKQLDKEKDKAKASLRELHASAERLIKEKGIVDLSKENLSLRTDLTEKEEALLRAAQTNFLVEQDTLALIEKRISYTKNLNKSVGLTGSLLKSASKITDKLGLHGVDYIFEDAAAASTDMAKSLGVSDQKALGLSGKIKVMKAGVKELSKGLLKTFTDPLFLLTAQIALIKKFYSAYGAVNQRIVDQQKQLGISYETSNKLYQSAHQYAASQRNAFVTEARILEGRHKLNEALGTSIMFTDKEAITAEKLEHYYGLSAEQNGRLAEFGREIGKTNDDILNTTIRTANEQKRQFGGAISYQKVIQKVSGVSGEILTKFKGNVKALTEAVMQADRLGLTLEQVDKIGESLLNFESSIENELKAELLTGKAINMEKARAAALSGDQVKLMSEISKQVGNIHDFEKLNVIQRKAYAEAFGMEVGEMGNMLRKKELEAKLGMDISKSATEALKAAEKKGITIDESLRKDLEAKSLAELQKYTFEKILSILTKISEGPMRVIYNLLEKGLKFTEGIFGFFSKMTGGALGSALGTAVLAAPLLIGATRLLSGGIKAMFLGKRGSSPANPEYVYDVASGGSGGGGGIMDMITGGGGKGFGGKRALVKRFGGAGAARTAMRGLKGGAIAAAIGIGTELVAGQMEEGEGKDVVSGIGQTASYAGTGAMIGSVIPGIGTAVGAIVGGGIGLIKSFFEAEESRKAREEANEKAQKEREKRTTEILEQFATRPVQLNVGGKTILDFNTAQNLYGTTQSGLA